MAFSLKLEYIALPDNAGRAAGPSRDTRQVAHWQLSG